jgi:hypothetical protein
LPDEKADNHTLSFGAPRRRTTIFDASLIRDRIAPINSQNPTPDNFQNDRLVGIVRIHLRDPEAKPNLHTPKHTSTSSRRQESAIMSVAHRLNFFVGGRRGPGPVQAMGTLLQAKAQPQRQPAFQPTCYHHTMSKSGAFEQMPR